MDFVIYYHRKYLFTSIFILLLIGNSALSIRDHDVGIKTKTFHRDQQISDALHESQQQYQHHHPEMKPIVMHHQYSRVISNKPNSEFDPTAATSTAGAESEQNRYYSQQYKPQGGGVEITYNQHGSNRVYHENNHGEFNTDRQGQRDYDPYGFLVENTVASYLEECPPEATGQFPYLYDCRRFLNCWKGRGYLQSCAPGTVFNPDTLECDSPKKVNCLGLGSPSKQSASTVSEQPQKQARLIQPPRTIGEVKCSPGLNGLEPHPFDCTKFLNCANGMTFIQDCGPGTAFNSEMLICDFPHKVNCGAKTIGGVITVESGRTYDATPFVSHGPRTVAEAELRRVDQIGNGPATAFVHSENYRLVYPSQPGIGQLMYQYIPRPIPNPNEGIPTHVPPQSNQNYPHDHGHHQHHYHPHGHSYGHGHGHGHDHGHGHVHDHSCNHTHAQGTDQVQKTDWSETNRQLYPSGQTTWTHTTVQNPVTHTGTSTVFIPGEQPTIQWMGIPRYGDHNPSGTTFESRTFQTNGNPDNNGSIYQKSEATNWKMQVENGNVNEDGIPQTYQKPGWAIQNSYVNPAGHAHITPETNAPDKRKQTNWTRTGTHDWPSSSDFYDLQKATVHKISETNFSNLPYDNTPASSDSKTSIYYAHPVEDSEEARIEEYDFSKVIGGDISPVTDQYRTDSNDKTHITRVTYSRSNDPLSSPSPFSSTVQVNDKLDMTLNSDPVENANFPYDGSNLYGGLLPPFPTAIHPSTSDQFMSGNSNTNTTMIIPSQHLQPPFQDHPIRNYTVNVLPPPNYSPSYSSISHSRNIPDFESLNHSTQWNSAVVLHNRNSFPGENDSNTTTTVVRTTTISNSTPIVFSRDTVLTDQTIVNTEDYPIFTYPPDPRLLTKQPSNNPHPVKSSLSAEFNHEYRNPPQPSVSSPSSHQPELDPKIKDLAMSEALKILLRPYLNRSGTVTTDDVTNSDKHIMNLFSPKPPLAISKDDNVEKEAELIFTDEQAHLIQEAKTHKSRPSTGTTREPENTYRHQHNHDHPGYDSNHQYRHQHSHHHNHHHHHNHSHNHSSDNNSHSREFHKNHPWLPNPFANENIPNESSTERTSTTYPIFIRPNPTTPTTETISRQPEFDLRFGAEETTPTVQFRNPSSRDREPFDSRHKVLTNRQNWPDPDTARNNFDCGNGKRITIFEVCDGVNNCGNRADEKNCDHLGYEVRLSKDGGNKHMGRVEVKILGNWGYVCDDKFGMRDADVLCKELGFQLGASEVRGNSYYSPYNELANEEGKEILIMMDEVDCRGNETSLKECNFKGWGVHDCGPDEIVGVVCKIPVMKCPHDYWLCESSHECIPPAFVCDNVVDCGDQSDESTRICNSPIEYRLVNGNTKTEGRVEVKYRGVWGTVCDDDFSEIEAQILCRSLGYHGRAQIVKNAFGPGSGPIWLDQVSCIGNETSLHECNHWTWGEHNCNHNEDLSIRCSLSGITPILRNNNKETRERDQQSSEEVDLDFYKVERSSKFLRDRNRQCGIINENATDEFDIPEERMQRVVQGSRARKGHHPWQATIRTRGRSGKSTHWCGAVLISDRHLLTAAHCLSGYSKGAYFIRMGDHYANIAESSEIDVFIENWYIHEQFRKGTHMNNDIALITLKHPVQFNDYVQPICLPKKNVPYPEKKVCIISGWGSIQSGISTPSNQLRAAKIPIISDDVCKQPHVYGNSITEGMFCAGYLDESVDACDGDSGGPLVCHNDGVEALYGIISWGQHCGYANKPGVYVKIGHYIDWINEKLNFSHNMNGN